MRRLKQLDRAREACSAVRSCSHKMGLRFRLGGRGLPGEPDLVFPVHQTAIFVCPCERLGHGCPTESWWGRHFPGAVRAQQDALRRFTATLQNRGWRVGVIWSCETKDAAELERRIRESLLLPS